MGSFADGVKTIAAVLGVVLIFWNAGIVLRSYLSLDVSAGTPAEGRVILTVSLTNAAILSKRIDYAMMLIAADGLLPADAARSLQGCRPDVAYDERKPLMWFFHARPEAALDHDGYLLLPLTELYGEQAAVGPNEKIAHACSVDLGALVPGETYIARFVVFIAYFGVYLRWRYTATAFTVPGAPAPRARPRPYRVTRS